MNIPKGTIVAVADGEILNLFRNSGDENAPQLAALADAPVAGSSASSGGHPSSAANPDESQKGEDGFAAGIAGLLNKRVLDGKIEALIVVAAPRTLGELRKHWHKALSAVLIGEIAKDLTGHSTDQIAAAVEKA